MKRGIMLSILINTCILLASLAPTMLAQAPKTFSYQGVLTDPSGVPVADGSYAVRFQLYPDESGGAAAWTENQSVEVRKGLFNVLLGTVTPLSLPFDRPYWLGVAIDGGAELAPRTALTGVPYSILSSATESISGINAGGALIGTYPNPDIADKSVKAIHIDGGQIVKGINGLTDEVKLIAGSNVTIAETGQDITISATPGGGGGDITAVFAGPGLVGGGLTGDVGLQVKSSGIENDMIQDGAITQSKLSAAPVGAGQMLSTTGADLQWMDVPIFSLPYSGSASTTFASGALSITNTGTGEAIRGSAVRTGIHGISGSPNSTTPYYAGVWGDGERLGVNGTAPANTNPNMANFGVRGTSDIGVIGSTIGATVGISTVAGVIGQSETEAGVAGRSLGSHGVVGESSAANGHGLYGWATGASGFGVFGYSQSSLAGFFQGNVSVTGHLAAGSKSFRIDHPLDPQNKYLQHVSVESPDMMTVYNGNAVCDSDGKALVTLPSYFEALNGEYRYQLTCIGRYAPVYVAEEVRGNTFRIAGGSPGLKVSWQITGIRKDPFAEKNRIAVEPEKAADARGSYLHPAAYGQPASIDLQD